MQDPEPERKSGKLQGRMLIIAIAALMGLWIYAVVAFLM